MRKRGGAISIALEPNSVPASMGTSPAREQHAMTPAERELQLIERAKQDPRAFAPLYDTYADMVWKFAMSRLRDPERAQDVTSQTFVKAIKSLPRFNAKLQGEGTSFPGWLMMITRNTIIDDQRKHRPTADIESPAIEPQLAASRTPESIAIRREEQQRVRKAISQLNPRQQRMVELRIAGYSGQEIADIMGISLNGVRTAHSRAYKKLRELLADDIG